MAQDLLASRVTVSFNGGSLTAKRGVLRAVFGDQFIKDGLTAETQISRRAHQRRRKIGGPTTSVSAASYSIPAMSTSSGGSTLGGEAIRVLVDGKWWTMRLSGSHKAFNALLGSGLFESGKVVFWRAESGRPYGPFSAQTEI
jgi:hypothetical protein